MFSNWSYAKTPQEFAAGLANEVITKVAKSGVSDEHRAQEFRSLFVKNFDIPAISRFVTGRFWKPATPEQQKEFLKLFEDTNVITWSRRFKEYSSQKVEIVGASKPDEGGVITIESKILQPNNAAPVVLLWRVMKHADDFKVVDLVIEGLSMAMTHQSDYRSILQKDGMDGLLKALQQKLTQLQKK